MKCLSVYDNCSWGVGGYKGESKRRNKILAYLKNNVGTAVAQWLRFCATNRKVAGTIPAGVIGTFH